ncbi:MAG TPA: alpha/beta hydrolase [Stellaceae bacterium]|nr:alpha/beta hydrolase [Stellaceae bacterium]
MSLQAELVRFALRRSMKHGGRFGRTIPETRRRMAACERFVPPPPRGFAMHAFDAGGVPAERITPPAVPGDRHVLYLHGGGFATGSPRLYRNLTWRLAAAAAAPLLCLDYRLAPEHPFPAALDDAVAGYRFLLEDGADPRRIAVLGDSAGGGLVFSLLLRLRDEGVRLPGTAVALSPWTDLALSGESLRTNAAADPMINADRVPPLADYYLAGADPHTPYASPLYGDLAGLPPLLIQVGSDEILRDDSVRIAQRVRAAGGPVALEIWPRMPHVWHSFAPLVPESRRAIARVGAFVHGHIG